MPDPIWKPIEGYAGIYEVSDHGDVRSLRTGRLLKRVRRGRYPGFNLFSNGVGRGWFLHHLVAFAFLGPRPDGMVICHINGDPEDARVDNLRYDTRSANNRDSIRHGTHRSVGRTHCVNGHDLSAVGTYESTTVATDGGERHRHSCRVCVREASARYYASKKARA